MERLRLRCVRRGGRARGRDRIARPVPRVPLPLTGITLPFVAYGGSSLVTNWMLVGILMRVSQVSERMRGGGPS
ncbi:MAG: hypothetical protein E6I14_07600 [Chloroflexi bacterium]|nr:MAG: hypothetical protein E6I14_07600 [Chloroflexota bacterium]